MIPGVPELRAGFYVHENEHDASELAQAVLIAALARRHISGDERLSFPIPPEQFLDAVKQILGTPIYEDHLTLCDCKPHGLCVGMPDEKYRGPKVEDCEAIGNEHEWYNIDDVFSGCYHCQVTRQGQVWK
jgi:hypothetical protein